MHLFISQHYLCIKSHEHSLDVKVLFIDSFQNRNNTITNNTAQNNNKQMTNKSPSLPLELKNVNAAL